jgi:hypothetical protein
MPKYKPDLDNFEGSLLEFKIVMFHADVSLILLVAAYQADYRSMCQSSQVQYQRNQHDHDDNQCQPKACWTVKEIWSIQAIQVIVVHKNCLCF